MTLFVIGRHPERSRLPIASNIDIESVAADVRGRKGIVARCDDPSQLVQIVADAASDGPINRLDLFDHGRAGAIALGEDILFESDSDPTSPLKGAEVADAIRPYLSDVAHVRLLGCYTGEEAAGRLLITKLAAALGGRRVVFGVIDRLTKFHFNEDGYDPDMESQRLFSSLSALDSEAPTALARALNIIGIIRGTRR